MKQHMHPGAKWIFRLRAYYGFLFLFLFMMWFVVPLIITSGILTGAILLILYAVFVIAIAEIYAQMSYNRYFYEFAATILKTERGIIWKHYSNVPYKRVQNVDIRRGILARILGFSSVMIQTAGYSYGGAAGLTEGYIPAVSVKEAEKIREFLIKKIGRKHDGL